MSMFEIRYEVDGLPGERAAGPYATYEEACLAVADIRGKNVRVRLVGRVTPLRTLPLSPPRGER